MKKLVFLIFLVAKTGTYAAETPRVSIVCDPTPAAPVVHGLDKLSAALEKQHILFEKVHSLQEAKGAWLIVTGEAATPLLQTAHYRIPDSAEALTIRKTSWKGKPTWLVAGHDPRGTMYGLLDVADRIGWATNAQLPFSEVKETSESPHVEERAISIYTMNRAYWESRFYDEQYWTRYLDMLAADRFNTLVVIFGYENGGFLAPCYPYFFNVDGFPDVRMVGLSAEQQQKNLTAFNRLIQMAHDRGIRFTVGIWDHIYRGGVQGGGIPGTKDSPDQPTPGLVWGLNGDNLVGYTKAALAKFVQEVPGLDAIQFRMHDESGLKNGEQDAFWSDIFKMMKTTKPQLLLDLRVKELKESIIKSALDIGVNFRLDTKYWMEQMGLPYHPTQINPEKSPRRHSYSDLLRYPQRYKMHWQLWSGGTSRVLLWGDPEYVRRFAESTHLYDGDGYEVNEPLATKMEAQPHDAKPFELLNPQYRYYDYEFERYWHFFQVFGRIGYDPKTPAMTWDQEFVKRFGPRAAPLIEKALHKASWVLPRIIASCYPYSSFPTTRGWAEKQHLGDLPFYAKAEGSDLMQFANPDDEAKLLIEDGATPRLLPSANSKWLLQVSTEISQLVAAAKKNNDHPSKEFTATITDLSILSQLALYHSRRITAAVNYRIFERTQSPVALDDAIAGEKKAIDAWRGIVIAAGDVYTDDLAMGVRVADLCGHWKDELPALEEGLKKLEDKRRGLTTSSNTPHYDPAAIADNHSLFRITDKPVGKHAAGEPITIRIKVTAAAGIKWVRLRYRAVSQEQEYQTLPMLPAAEKDVYEATVPAAQINPEWDLMYLFEVMDNNNKGAVFPDVSKATPYHIIKLKRHKAAA